MTLVSKCCGAEVFNMGIPEFNWEECGKCQEPCLTRQKEEVQEWAKMFDWLESIKLTDEEKKQVEDFAKELAKSRLKQAWEKEEEK